MNSITILNSAEETVEFGRKFGAKLPAGSVLALTGPLGAGKTTFVKGIAEALGIPEPVTSPSFTLIKEYYSGIMPLYHMDLYRIGSSEEFYYLGANELLYGDGISIIEWSEKASDLLPETAIHVIIDINKDGGRTITVKGFDS